MCNQFKNARPTAAIKHFPGVKPQLNVATQSRFAAHQLFVQVQRFLNHPICGKTVDDCFACGIAQTFRFIASLNEAREGGCKCFGIEAVHAGCRFSCLPRLPEFLRDRSPRRASRAPWPRAGRCPAALHEKGRRTHPSPRTRFRYRRLKAKISRIRPTEVSEREIPDSTASGPSPRSSKTACGNFLAQLGECRDQQFVPFLRHEGGNVADARMFLRDRQVHCEQLPSRFGDLRRNRHAVINHQDAGRRKSGCQARTVPRNGKRQRCVPPPGIARGRNEPCEIGSAILLDTTTGTARWARANHAELSACGSFA